MPGGELVKFPVPCQGVNVCCRVDDAERRLLSRALYVTAGTDIAVTAISAPTDVPLLNGVRPRSDWGPAQTRCPYVTYLPLTRTACPVSFISLSQLHFVAMHRRPYLAKPQTRAAGIFTARRPYYIQMGVS